MGDKSLKHIVILSGGFLNLAFTAEYMKSLSYDRLFAVDGGLEYAGLLDLMPDYVVGDFDTVRPEILSFYEELERQGNPVCIERHPVKKDATDTELAVCQAMKEGATHITLLGATGSRLDHSLANVGLLKQTVERQVTMQIVDETNRIGILDGIYCPEYRIRKEKQFGTYISILPLTDEVKGVTLKGVGYPLEDATVYRGSSRTISNEIAGEEMTVTLEKGQLLLIESRDSWD